MRPWLLAGAGAILVGIAVWFGYRAFFSRPADDAAIKSAGTTLLDEVQGDSGAETVDVTPDKDLTAGTTPMAQRVAVLGLLNKRNGVARELKMKPGEAMRIGDVVVRLRACEETAPWEPEHYTGAFVQVDVEQFDHSWQRVFSGWLFKERPALNVVLHPIYDVWPKSCAMRFPSAGANTEIAPEPKRSSPKKSAPDPSSGEGEGGGEAPVANAPSTTPPTAADKRPI